MNKLKSLLLSTALFIICQSFGQSFVLQETNVKKNVTQCVNTAKKCQLVLLKKQTLYTLPFSTKSSLTNNAINSLADKFTNFYPKESAKGDGPFIERGFENPRDQIVKLTYAYISPNLYETTDYAQVVVFFDNSGTSPKINDIQVMNKIDLGILRLTEREKLKFKPEPIAQKPAAKPTTKPATKPATKATAKPTAKTTAKPATKPTTKPATKPSTKPAATPAAKKKT
jgi:cell division septation protein DedD